jgi:hypothetical protein
MTHPTNKQDVHNIKTEQIAAEQIAGTVRQNVYEVKLTICCVMLDNMLKSISLGGFCSPRPTRRTSSCSSSVQCSASHSAHSTRRHEHNINLHSD